MATNNTFTTVGTCTYKNVDISCVVGNIVECPLDAICVGCDPAFSLLTGGGKAVRKAGGHNFSTNLSANRSSLTHRSDILVVPASGTLKSQQVFLTPLRNFDKNSLDLTYGRIFAKAVELGIESLAITALGTGGFGVRLDKAARFMKKALRSANFGDLKRIQFMDLSVQAMQAFDSALQLLCSSPNNLPSANTTTNSSVDTSVSTNNITSSSANLDDEDSSEQCEEDSEEISSDSSFEEDEEEEESEEDLSIYQNLSGESDNDLPVIGNIQPPSINSPATSTTSLPISKDDEHFRVLSVEAIKKASAIDPESMCSICLSELFENASSQEDFDKNAKIVELNLCRHMFHKDCIESAFKVKNQCPNCLRWYSAPVGPQPINGSMRVVLRRRKTVPGCADADGYYEIHYELPNGIQTMDHLRPGKPYYGTSRIAYVPNNAEGTITLELLKLAFERRHIFTVGDSITSGQKDVVVWNNIHHKTSLSGGPSHYGYPDDDYLGRVQEELAQVGINKEMLEQGIKSKIPTRNK